MGTSRSDIDPQASVEDDLSKLYLRFSPEEHKIRGFAGKWTFYSPSSDNGEDITSQFRCLRTYDIISDGDDKNVVKFQTFNEFEPANGKAKKREIDGIYESSYLRSAADLFFSDNTALSESEKEENYPDCVYWRSAALDSENVMRIAPHLPPRPVAPGMESKYAKWIANNGPSGVFAFEAFLMDGQNRWSMGALYSLSDMSLLSHFCIQEHMVTVDPAKPMDFDKFEYRQLAGRLTEDPMTWFDSTEFRGEMTELIWDEDGEAMKLPPRPATFTPPSFHSGDNRLFLYEDGCYAFYPATLPAEALADDSAKQFGEGARFEMGLAHMDAQGVKSFRRLILRYSGMGAAVSLTKEHFKAEGSFEFDRRQSQSVRRSIGSRRVASHRSIDPGAHQHYARSVDHRAAKLKDAFLRAESEGNPSSQETSPQLPRMNSGGKDALDDIQVSNSSRDRGGNRA